MKTIDLIETAKTIILNNENVKGCEEMVANARRILKEKGIKTLKVWENIDAKWCEKFGRKEDVSIFVTRETKTHFIFIEKFKNMSFERKVNKRTGNYVGKPNSQNFYLL